MLAGLCRLTKSGGRIITFGNVWLLQQNLIAWGLNKLDFGLNIRTPEGYQRLIEGLPVSAEAKIFRDHLRIPYDHFCMTMTKV